MKRLGTALALLVLLLIAAAGGGYVWLRGSLPQTDGRLAVRGLEAPVAVVRDANGIPAIEARSQHDAYFALGFTHAQDRLWQMEMQRRVGAGRLAEVVGAPGISTDRFLRTLDIYRLAEATLARLEPEVRAALDAYVAGVNAWMTGRSGPLPPEFLVLGYEPEPWRPADSLVWGRLMSLQLSGNWRDELVRARLAEALTPAQLEQLWPPYPEGGATTTAVPPAPAEAMLAALPDALRPRLASNQWSVSGAMTDSGKPLLANDPHLDLTAPILWYLVSVTAPGLSVTGATVPGVPFHLLGHNGRIAWGMTTTHSDTMDLFVERLNGDGYDTPDGPAAFATRHEIIKVKGDEPVTLTVRESRHGPVVSDALKAAPPMPGQVLALASTGLLPDDLTPQALYKLNRAGNWDEFVTALRDFHSPQQNIGFADVSGAIGLYSPARVPIRRQGSGEVPAAGWSGAYDWTGWVPFDALPHQLDPPGGAIVNANNRLVGDDYPYLLTTDWPEPFRAQRILDMLAAERRFTRDDMTRMQMDALSPIVDKLKPLLLAAPTGSPEARKAAAMIAAWDGVMERGRPEPLIFETWAIHLGRRLTADELGAAAPQMAGIKPLFLNAALTARTSWCDDVRTPQAESCPSVIAAALGDAMAELSATHGADMSSWRWGDVHRAAFDHAIFKAVPLLDGWAGRRIATDGGDFTVNRGSYAGDFLHRHGAGLRAVYDLADLKRSRFVIATGQSGNPLSPHYADMMERWRDGGWIEMGGGGRTLTLEPQP